MPTFDGKTITRTRVKLDGDKFMPSMGALVGSGYKEDVLNHGTLNQLVTGNITRSFGADETIKTIGNQTETITGNRTSSIIGSETETIIGGRTTTIVGMLTETLVSGQMTLCVGPYNRTDLAPVTWLCPTSSQMNSGDWFEAKMLKVVAYAMRSTNVGVDIALRGTNTQLSLHVLNLFQFQTELATVEGFFAITTNKVNGLSNFLDGMRNHASGMIGNLRALEAGAGPEVTPPLALGAPPFD